MTSPRIGTFDVIKDGKTTRVCSRCLERPEFEGADDCENVWDIDPEWDQDRYEVCGLILVDPVEFPDRY